MDNSDEKNCKCLSNQFVCPSGECVAVDKLCDSKEGCSDRADEARCGKQEFMLQIKVRYCIGICDNSCYFVLQKQPVKKINSPALEVDVYYGL